jgi:hypothetical protein
MGSGGRPPASGPPGGPGGPRRSPPDEAHEPGRLERLGAATAARAAAAAAVARATAQRIGRTPPPPGPFRPGFWRSPIRGPWLTSVFGLLLLVGIPVLFVTGMLSYAAYNPGLGND